MENCIKCSASIDFTRYWLKCTKCKSAFYSRCLNMNEEMLKSLIEFQPGFFCTKCKNEKNKNVLVQSPKKISQCVAVPKKAERDNTRNNDETTPKTAETLDYDLRSGTTSHGFNYENLILALLAIKCARTNYKNFWICNNVDGLCKLDDVLLYTEQKSSVKQLVFIQLKHIQNVDTKRFRLQYPENAKKKNMIPEVGIANYVASYNAIKDMISEDRKCETPKTKKLLRDTKVNFTNMKFVFMTNTTFVDVDGYDELVQMDWDDLLIVNTKRSACIFKLTESYARNRSFEEQFFVCPRQAGCVDKEMEKLIIEELNAMLDTNLIQFDNVAQQFVQFVEDWFAEPRILRKNDVHDEIARLVLQSFSCELNQLSEKNFSHQNGYETWNDITADFQVVLVPTTNEYINQSLMKNDRWVLIKCDKIYDDLLRTVLRMSKKRSAILVKEPDVLEKYARRLAASGIKTLYRLKDLSDVKLAKLQNCAYNFQGRRSTLGELLEIDASIITLFTTDDLLNLLAQDFHIGDSHNLSQFYIERSLSKRILDVAVFTTPDSEFIVIDPSDNFGNFYANNAHQIRTSQSKIKVFRDDTDVAATVKSLEDPTKIIFVLKLTYHNENYVLEYLHSKTKILSPVRKHVTTSCTSSIVPLEECLSYFTNDYATTNVIIGDFRSGKTWFLDYLASVYPTSSWIIKVQLDKLDLEVVKDFATFLHQYTDGLSVRDKAVFKRFHQKGNILVLCDGLNGTNSELLSSIAAEIIRDIVNAKTRVIITSEWYGYNTRLLMLRKVPFELEELNNDRQIDFLSKYYARHSGEPSLSRGEAIELAQKVFRRLNITEWDGRFANVQLQTRMLAEVFVDGNMRNKFPQQLVSVCERYVDMQIQRSAVSKKRFASLKRNFILAALDVTLPGEYDPPSKEFIEDIKAENYACGLINGLDKHDKVVFVDKCFAEFLSATKFFNDRQGVILVQLRCTRIKEIFDRMLCANCAVHGRILNKDVSNLMVEDDLSGDKCGRSSTFLVASRAAWHDLNRMKQIEMVEEDPYYDTFNFLLQNRCFVDDLKTPDSVTGLTPLQCLETRQSASFFNLLFRHGLIERCSLFDKWDEDKILDLCAKKDYDCLARALIDAKCITDETLRYKRKNRKNLGVWQLPNGSLLHCAAECNCPRMINLLLNYADVNDVNERNETALYVACCSQNANVVKLLVDRGANIFIAQREGLTALDIATQRKHKDNLKLLSEFDLLKKAFGDDVNKELTDGKDTALHWACRAGNFTTVKTLVEAENANVHGLNARNESPVECACNRGHLDIMMYLIGRGADVFKMRTLSSPLRNAIVANSDGITSLVTYEFLKNAFGDDVNKALNEEETRALHFAASAGNADAVKELLANGADINATDTNNQTPLHLAVLFNRIELAIELVNAGADANVRTNHRFWKDTPLNLARKSSRDAVIFLRLYEIIKEKDDEDVATYNRLRKLLDKNIY